MQAKIDYALWEEPGTSSQASSRSNREESLAHEQNGSSSNGAHPQLAENGSHSLAHPEAAGNVVDPPHTQEHAECTSLRQVCITLLESHGAVC